MSVCATSAPGAICGVGEVVSRWVSDTTANDRAYRVNFGLDVKVGEKWLNFAFGKDFSSRNGKSLLLLANLQWNLGEERAIKPIDQVDLDRVASQKHSPGQVAH